MYEKKLSMHQRLLDMADFILWYGYLAQDNFFEKRRWVYDSPCSKISLYVEDVNPPESRADDPEIASSSGLGTVKLGFEDRHGGIELRVYRDLIDKVLESDPLAAEVVEAFERTALAYNPITSSRAEAASLGPIFESQT